MIHLANGRAQDGTRRHHCLQMCLSLLFLLNHDRLVLSFFRSALHNTETAGIRYFISSCAANRPSGFHADGSTLRAIGEKDEALPSVAQYRMMAAYPITNGSVQLDHPPHHLCLLLHHQSHRSSHTHHVSLRPSRRRHPLHHSRRTVHHDLRRLRCLTIPQIFLSPRMASQLCLFIDQPQLQMAPTRTAMWATGSQIKLVTASASRR